MSCEPVLHSSGKFALWGLYCGLTNVKPSGPYTSVPREPLEGLLRWILGLTQDFTLAGGAWECAFLTSPQVVLLLVPHAETTLRQNPRAPAVRIPGNTQSLGRGHGQMALLEMHQWCH